MMKGLLVDNTAVLGPSPVPAVFVIFLIAAPTQPDGGGDDRAETALIHRLFDLADSGIVTVLEHAGIRQPPGPGQINQFMGLFGDQRNGLLRKNRTSLLKHDLGMGVMIAAGGQDDDHIRAPFGNHLRGVAVGLAPEHRGDGIGLGHIQIAATDNL